MTTDASVYSHNLHGPRGTNCPIPDLLCTSPYLSFQPKVLPLLLEVCFSFLPSKLLVGCHKWLQNSILSSLLFFLPSGSWSWSWRSPSSRKMNCLISLSCSCCHYIRAEFDVMVCHRPHLRQDVCVCVCVVVWRSNNALIYSERDELHCYPLRHQVTSGDLEWQWVPVVIKSVLQNREILAICKFVLKAIIEL